MSAVASAWTSTTITLTSRRQRGEHAVGGGERAIDRPHERPAEQREDGDARAVRGGDDGVILARGGRREVGRLDDGLGRVGEHVGDVELLVDVVAERDGIDAGGAELAVLPGRQPRAAGGVLGVGDDEVEPFRGAKQRHGPPHEREARRADDVAEEEEAHVAPIYFAVSTLRVSRTTVTLISPG